VIATNWPTDSTWPLYDPRRDTRADSTNWYEIAAYFAPPDAYDWLPDAFLAFLAPFIPAPTGLLKKQRPALVPAWWIRPRPKEQGRAGQPSTSGREPWTFTQVRAARSESPGRSLLQVWGQDVNGSPLPGACNGRSFSGSQTSRGGRDSCPAPAQNARGHMVQAIGSFDGFGNSMERVPEHEAEALRSLMKRVEEGMKPLAALVGELRKKGNEDAADRLIAITLAGVARSFGGVSALNIAFKNGDGLTLEIEEVK
jgi:hypothetical protein